MSSKFLIQKGFCLKILNKYRNSIDMYFRDTVITCIVNTGTCVFAGIVTFSILGHMAHNQVFLKT